MWNRIVTIKNITTFNDSIEMGGSLKCMQHFPNWIWNHILTYLLFAWACQPQLALYTHQILRSIQLKLTNKITEMQNNENNWKHFFLYWKWQKGRVRVYVHILFIVIATIQKGWKTNLNCTLNVGYCEYGALKLIFSCEKMHHIIHHIAFTHFLKVIFSVIIISSRCKAGIVERHCKRF